MKCAENNEDPNSLIPAIVLKKELNISQQTKVRVETCKLYIESNFHLKYE